MSIIRVLVIILVALSPNTLVFNLVGCSDSNQLFDFDGDGTPDSEDCAPEDASIYPGAPENCTDGVENDCDGLVDNEDSDCTDQDSDGYAANVDCNDHDPDVHPGAVEECNSVDDDCDGDIDEGCGDDDDDATGDDDDTTGDDDDSTDDDDDSATSPDTDNDGWTIAAGDCDDSDPSINPGQSEICNDWLDNDCDGTDNGCALSGVIPLANADAKQTGEMSGDGAGFAVAFAGDTSGDGLDDLLISALFNGSSGAVYLVLGAPSGTNSLSGAEAKITKSGQWVGFGSSVASAGDVNGDGLDDVLIGDKQGTGQACYFQSPLTGALTHGDADGRFIGDTDANAGQVVGVGDTNGDGVPDCLVGGYGAHANDTNSGVAYVLEGPLAGVVDAIDADAFLTGESTYDYAGWAIAAAGDTNGDGLADLLISSVRSNGVGKVYLVRSPNSGTSSLGSADAILREETVFDEAGKSLDGGHDVDGDGFGDLLIGAPGSDLGGANSGAAYVVGGTVSGDVYLSVADARLIGASQNEQVGLDVAFAGDVNGDGIEDILVCAPGADRVYLAYGPFSGDVDLSFADATFTAESPGDLSQCTVAGGGDTNGDGYSDLLIGAQLQGIGGAVYVVYGKGR